jgi:hypothetical protein
MGLACVLAATAVIAAQAGAPRVAPTPPDCSVVVVRCAAPPPPEVAPPRPTTATRRPNAAADASLLDAVVIEAERLPGTPNMSELLQRAARPSRPVQFTTRTVGDTTCTCFEPCVMNCCQCTVAGDSRPGFVTGR